MKKEIIKFYSDYKLYIFPAIVALSSLFLIIFAIYPQTVKLIEGQKTASDLINRSKFLDIKVVALESYDGTDLANKVGFVLNALPAEKDYGNILTLLSQLVSQSGFSIASINVGNSSGKVGNLDTFEVKLDIIGVQALLQTLLSNIESSPRLIRVKSIDVSSNQGKGNIAVSLALQVLYAALPQNFGAPDSPLPQLSQSDESLISTLEKSSAGTQITSGSSPRGKSNPFE
ncbi:MAG: type 4a pilus biogenesis protein PilO [Candidatus Daviesbacteria bacterium]|nr:type 4a pilus biogenesis protein PilO [Candidatus Daviesbacteria bacterium]